jgi:hypothetical protein
MMNKLLILCLIFYLVFTVGCGKDQDDTSRQIDSPTLNWDEMPQPPGSSPSAELDVSKDACTLAYCGTYLSAVSKLMETKGENTLSEYYATRSKLMLQKALQIKTSQQDLTDCFKQGFNDMKDDYNSGLWQRPTEVEMHGLLVLIKYVED